VNNINIVVRGGLTALSATRGGKARWEIDSFSRAWLWRLECQFDFDLRLLYCAKQEDVESGMAYFSKERAFLEL
jgi:hypothetical protein